MIYANVLLKLLLLKFSCLYALISMLIFDLHIASVYLLPQFDVFPTLYWLCFVHMSFGSDLTLLGAWKLDKENLLISRVKD